jgi:hemolysin activation/secretion protein
MRENKITKDLLMSPKPLAFALLYASSLFAASTIDSISFEGNEKIPTKTLIKSVHSYIGASLDSVHAQSAAKDVENYYRKHNYTLAFAQVKEINEANRSILIKIGKYKDFNERAITEMKQKEIIPNTISQINFEGNEKISTRRLIKLILPTLGKANTVENQNALIADVQNYYRKNNFALAYAQISKNENSIITIQIKKYSNFKALYAREGKK